MILPTYATHATTVFAAETVIVPITPDLEERAIKLAAAIAAAKGQEYHHLQDPRNREKRFSTGNIAEVAVEKMLGVPFIDTSIGRSAHYAGADLKHIGLRMGIKSACYENDKFPMPLRNESDPQIICFVLPKVVLVCGVASVPVLQKYCMTELVIDPKARDRKTGFYGIDHLIRFRNYVQLVRIADGLHALIH